MAGVAGVQWGGEGGEEEEEGEEEEAGERGGHLQVLGELLFRTREEAEAHLREALGAGDDGTTGMTGMTRGTRVVTSGRGVTRGVRWGLTRGLRRKGIRG